MKKCRIHEFDPVIYPRKLWVCLNATVEGLLESFDIKDATLADALKNNAATTCITERKSDGHKGVVIFTNKRKYMTTKVMAHESVHFADAVFQELCAYSQEFNHGNEPYAYLVGWSAGCIDESLKYKIK
jgi:hypothetical protein